MAKGLLITLEGIEGCGKSTACKFIYEWLTGLGLKVVTTREPGGTALGEKVRSILLDEISNLDSSAELFLFEAARAQLCKEVLKPQLEQGAIVLLDRFCASTMAYQGKHSHNLNIEATKSLNLVSPYGDICLLFDLSVLHSRARTQSRAKADLIESRSNDYFEQVRNNYLELAKEHSKFIKLIDAAQDLTSVQNQIKLAITPLLQERGFIERCQMND